MKNKKNKIKFFVCALFVGVFLCAFQIKNTYALDSYDPNVSENDSIRMTPEGVTVGETGILTSNGVLNSSTPASPAPTSKKFEYTLLEGLPGFFGANQKLTDLPSLILSIYKFGIWTVGIAGLFMLVIGGFMYMASAGNTSTAGNARGIIWDALLGIVAALGAYLILYVINPDLTKVNLNFTAVDVSAPLAEGGLGGKCEPILGESNPCSVSNLTQIFGSNATKASSICKVESGGKQAAASKTDVCQDGNSFSIGLFQINMTDTAGSVCDPRAIFTTGASKGDCLARNSSNTCIKWSCSVINTDAAKAAYASCTTKLKDTATNMNIAKQISNSGSSWGRWGANRICRF